MLSYLNLLRISNLLLTAMTNKLNRAYKTIGEVTELLNLKNKNSGKLNTHVLRYWEKEFKSIKPRILSGRRRYYNIVEIEKLKKIKFLLKTKGLTIKGAKYILDNDNSLDLDETLNHSINTPNKEILKRKISKISKLIKNIKNRK